MRVGVENVTVELDGVTVLADAQLAIESGEFVGVVGPNGSGKSTLLRTIYRALRPAAGAVRVADADVWRLSSRESALRTAVVVQESMPDFEFTVLEVVEMGRSPHKGPLDRTTPADDRICRSALAGVGMEAVADRLFASLSGGEKQRVLVARALAQQGRVLVLDEPTNHLDIRFQLELLDVVQRLDVTTIAALHDLNLAANYCDRLYVLERGHVVAAGRTGEVLTPELVAHVFGVRLRRWTDPDTGSVHLGFDRLERDTVSYPSAGGGGTNRAVAVARYDGASREQG